MTIFADVLFIYMIILSTCSNGDFKEISKVNPVNTVICKTVQIDCGNFNQTTPKVNITWYFNNVMVNKYNQVINSYDRKYQYGLSKCKISYIKIYNITENDIGSYRCIIEQTGHNSKSYSYMLTFDNNKCYVFDIIPETYYILQDLPFYLIVMIIGVLVIIFIFHVSWCLISKKILNRINDGYDVENVYLHYECDKTKQMNQNDLSDPRYICRPSNIPLV
ncbi:putative immunoglobulin-like domain containing protein [Namao virus]|nr:putative immunoglobulin-like domain containing protein [Namao virus]